MNDKDSQIQKYKDNPKSSFYVYAHLKATDKTPFYVGKGSRSRAWIFSNRNNWWRGIKNKYGCLVDIIFENLTEEEALACEVDIILEYKYLGYTLTNLTSGGEGISGYIFTDEDRLNVSNKVKGRIPYNKKEIKITKKRLSATGDKNHFADKQIYTFIRLIDKVEFTGTRSQLCQLYNLNNSYIKKLFNKRNPRKSANGWKLK